MIVTHGSKSHDQSGEYTPRKSTWKPWTVEDAIARLDGAK